MPINDDSKKTGRHQVGRGRGNGGRQNHPSTEIQSGAREAFLNFNFYFFLTGKQLQEDQINAIYRLFSALDVNNSGEVDADPNKVKSEAWNAELKGLFKEIEVFLEDKDDSNTVSFAEFFDQFSKNPIPTSDIVNLANNFTAALALV